LTGNANYLFPFTRRQFIKSAGAASLLLGNPVGVSLASNATGEKLHGLSSFGELKYSSDFERFDYANADAPKGGLFAFSPPNWGMNQNTQTFNTLNSYVLKGAAPPRMELCFDTLMARAIDEPDALYCAASKSVEISVDRNSYFFELREEARFHDGSMLTADDVVFSFNIIKQKGHPQLSQDMINLDEVRRLNSHKIELRFNGKQSDRVILAMASSIPIFSKTFYQEREFDSSNLETPLGSGQWRVGKFSAGQYIEYDRVKNYWAANLPFASGLNHFDTLRIEFYSERISAFEAFKKGAVLWREEFTSKVWATEYNFPSVRSGKVVQKYFPGELRPSMQGWAINTRRKRFSDIRVRRAIGHCFDFEWTNKNLFYNAYTRSQSLFEKSSFKAEGRPGPEEITLLKSLTGEIPDSVFDDAPLQPISNGSGNDRKNLRTAFGLFQAAGWTTKNGKLVNDEGTQFSIEFLNRSKSFEKILGGMTNNLRQLGIKTNIRFVDPSQYQARVEDFNFDITSSAFSFSPSPTAEGIRKFFHSEVSDIKGSYNTPGIRLAVVDQLIDRLSGVKNRNEMIIVMRCIDRVLRAYQFWIPNWFTANHRVAMWDMFGWQEPKPDYAFPVESLWWHDEEKAKMIGKG
jgi:microcin C transport system substrate-binding protein